MTLMMAHQPLFVGSMEWWGRIAFADVFVLSDHNDYEPYSPQNRHDIDGVSRTLPIVHEGRPLPINETRVAWGDPLVKKLRRVVEMGWPREPYRDIARDILRAALEVEETDGPMATLGDVTMNMITHIAACLPVETNIVRATDLSDLPGGQSDAIASWATAAGADTYWCGISGSEYLRPEVFDAAGIEVWEIREQEPGRPVLDYIAAHGPENTALALPVPAPERRLTAGV